MNMEKRNYCVYAIQSEMTGRIYIGQTNQLQRRLADHNEGRVKSTKHERPWSVLAIEQFVGRSQARWFENCLKRSKGKRLAWLEKNIV